MKHLFLTLFAAAGLSYGIDPTSPVDAGEHTGLSQNSLEAMEQRIKTISDPVAKLFYKANMERAKGEPELALKTLAQLIVHHAHDEKWIARSELISAELYLELGLYDAADVTARQIQMIYEGTDVADKATTLRSKIKILREETEAKQGDES